jgi:hypothetical protein
VDPKKIATMQEWSCPKILKILHGVLGLIGYYKKLVKNYAKIATPFTTLLKKNNLSCNEATDQAFSILNQAMCNTPILVVPNFSNTFALECDVSSNGLGVILMQEGRPLAFTNK